MAGYNGDGGDRNRNIEGLGKDKVMDYQQEVGDEPDTTNVFCYSGIGAGNISNSVVRASEVQEVGEEFACLSSFNSHPFRIRNPIRLKDLNKNHADASKAVKAVKEEQRRKDEVDKLKMQVEKLIETVDDLTADNKKLNSTVSHLQCQLTGVVATTMLSDKPVTNQSNSELDEHGAKGCERRFPCPHCAVTFTKKGNMQRHVKIIHEHNNKTVMTRKVCDKTFPDKTHLKSHMAIHTGVNENLCCICGRSFLKKKTLDNHMQNHN